MNKIIAVVNQKGGVGKTTSTINLGTALAAIGKKVLIVDLDSQGNASTGLGVEDRTDILGAYDLLSLSDLDEDVSIETEVKGLYVAPSTIDLAGIDAELINIDDREYRLKKSLSNYNNFDYILLDCPPSLGFITLNALTAADSVFVPLQAEFYALEGLSYLLNTVKKIQTTFNKNLKIEGVILTMHDKRNNLCVQVEDDVRNHLGDLVYKTIIPRNIRIAEAPSYGLPVILYDNNCIGAKSYILAAREMLKRNNDL